MTVAELLPRVEKGVALLDAHDPDWWRRINVQALDLSSCVRCVIGQLCGNYTLGLADLRLSPSEAIAHGFSITPAEMVWEATPKTWQALTEAWVTIILARQFAAQDQPSVSVEVG